MRIFRKSSIGVMMIAAMLSGCITFYLNNLDEFTDAVLGWLGVYEEEHKKAITARATNDDAALNESLMRIRYACQQIADLKEIGREVLYVHYGQRSSIAVVTNLQADNWDHACKKSQRINELTGREEFFSRLDQEEDILEDYGDTLRKSCGCPKKDFDAYDDLSGCEPKSQYFNKSSADPGQSGWRYDPSTGNKVEEVGVFILGLATLNASLLIGTEVTKAERRAECRKWHAAYYLPQRERVMNMRTYCQFSNRPTRIDGVSTAEELNSTINDALDLAENWGLDSTRTNAPYRLFSMASAGNRICEAGLPLDVYGTAADPNSPFDATYNQEPQSTPTPSGYTPPPTPIPDGPIGEPPTVLDPPALPPGEIPLR